MYETVFLLLLLLLSYPAQSAEVSVGRYTLSENEASKAQRFPLIDTRTTSIPATVITNRQAVDFILMQTGYAQASDSVRSMPDKMLMRKAVAKSNRKLVNLTVLEMLNVIAGLGYVPLIDPINRLVAFEATYDFTH